MRFASLGSGSEGNGLVVEAGAGDDCFRVLLDCGFTLKESVRRLQRLGLTPDCLDAIVVTHEHSDHLEGVFRLARRFDLPVWGSHGTLSLLSAEQHAALKIRICCSDRPFAIGDLQVLPYTVPHDAREPTQFTFSDGIATLGVLTDAGQGTPHIVEVLSGVTALVLECNHDRTMLKNSSYPYMLKQRIGGAFGHLANDSAAGILAALDNSRLRCVVAAHLSQQNNTPALARTALLEALGSHNAQICIADQHEGLGWVEI